MTDKKERTRHPSTQISEELLRDLCHQFYLRRLEPPMTLEQSLATTRYDIYGKISIDDAKRRKQSEIYLPLMRDVLYVLYDLGLLKL